MGKVMVVLLGRVIALPVGSGNQESTVIWAVIVLVPVPQVVRGLDVRSNVPLVSTRCQALVVLQVVSPLVSVKATSIISPPL